MECGSCGGNDCKFIAYTVPVVVLATRCTLSIRLVFFWDSGYMSVRLSICPTCPRDVSRGKQNCLLVLATKQDNIRMDGRTHVNEKKLSPNNGVVARKSSYNYEPIDGLDTPTTMNIKIVI